MRHALENVAGGRLAAVEATLAALTSFTLVGPLGLPWWLPIVCLAAMAALSAGLRTSRWRRPDCSRRSPGTVGGLIFAAWAGADRLWSGSGPQAALRARRRGPSGDPAER